MRLVLPVPPSPNREEWRVLSAWPAYEVSSLGMVRRLLPSRGTRPGRIIKPSIGSHGYMYVGLRSPGDKNSTRVLVHRLVATAFVPNPCALPVVNHLNGNKLDCAVCNLEWTTRAGNCRHAGVAGLVRRGVAHHKAKLNNDTVRSIRAEHELGVSTRELAQRVGVAQSTIWQAVRGITWRVAQ